MFVLLSSPGRTAPRQQQPPSGPQQQAPGQQTPAPGAPQVPTPQPPPAPPQAPLPPPKPTLSVVVLDPAHGGTDAGARGEHGVVESEVVLTFAAVIRVELEHQGLRVVSTRHANENPSFDDRSAVANGQRGAVFLTLHVSSTGQVGTARVYSAAPGAAQLTNTAIPAGRPALLPWERAQEPYTELSRRFAELLQIQIAQKFRGSPEVPTTAAVRQLRTVAAPAVAVEVSSVSVPDRNRLERMSPALAEAVARAVMAFRPLYEAGTK